MKDTDEEAVGSLAAGIACKMLAALYSQTSDPNLDADVTDYEAKADQFESLATNYMSFYGEHLGVKVGEGAEGSKTKPAAFSDDVDVNFQWGGDKLFHPRRWR